MEVVIRVVAWTNVDPWFRYHGLAIDQPLNSDFWRSQPEKIVGVTARYFTFTRTVDLESGKHYVIYGNSTTLKDGVWIAEIYINDKLVGRKNDIYRGNFLKVEFEVGKPPEYGEYVAPAIIGIAAPMIIGGVIAYNEVVK